MVMEVSRGSSYSLWRFLKKTGAPDTDTMDRHTLNKLIL